MISVVTVSWNSHEDIQRLIGTIDRPEAQGELEVILLDNNSEPHSKTTLSNLTSRYFRLEKIFNSGNIGFGRACNIGAKAALGDMILFLNPDTKVDVATILEAGKRLKSAKDFQILGVQQVSDNGVSRTCCRPMTRVNTFISCSGLNKIFKNTLKGFEMIDWDHSEARFVGHVIGAFYLIKKLSFETLNGFDEEFFLYYEDLDLSARAIKANMRIYYDASLVIYHKGGGSSEKVGIKRIGFSVSSRDKIIAKHFGRFQQKLCRLIACISEFPLRVVKSVMRFEFQDLPLLTKIYWKMLWSPL